MKILRILLLLIFLPSGFFAQRKLAFDSIVLKNVTDLFSDDYGNIYLYKKSDLSLTKFDSVGNQLSKAMLTFPYKIQNISNPLNITMFSENTQQLKIMDQNLNDIQKIDLFKNFGFVKMVYAEDLQYIWLFDESNKTLIQYNYRTQSKINSTPFNINTSDIRDFMVDENIIYILKETQIEIYSTQGKIINTLLISDAKSFKKYRNKILIIGKNTIHQIDGKQLIEIFKIDNSKIVDKNSSGILALIANKLYLYKPKF